MTESYIIEVSSRTAGIVVRDDTGYRFFASAHDFTPMEGRYFRSARDAERAAIRFDHDRRAASVALKRGEAVA